MVSGYEIREDIWIKQSMAVDGMHAMVRNDEDRYVFGLSVEELANRRVDPAVVVFDHLPKILDLFLRRRCREFARAHVPPEPVSAHVGPAEIHGQDVVRLTR